MDFYRILTRETRDHGIELYPDFVVERSSDLMVQGRSFYAIWDEEAGLWTRDEYAVQRLVDEDLSRAADKYQAEIGIRPSVKYMSSFKNNCWTEFKKYMTQLGDNSRDLDSNITFANTEVKKTDYVSRKLPYPLEVGDTSGWDELIGTLYSIEERAKLEWAIGSIVTGDSKKIQKFLVLYGPAGSGKSTVLNIIQNLFTGYVTAFDGKALGASNGSFATEAFRYNPLVAIQHDGDLSRIADNTRLNSIIAHERMTMNEKYKPSYSSRVNAMLFMGTNQPVRISDAKSGIIRRLIDVHPTGVRIPVRHYHTLMGQIDFELGAIAAHCQRVYLEMGKNYYNNYRPLEMMLQTDVFFNFVEAYYDVFKEQDSIALKQAYTMYKEYCAESGIDKPLPQYKMREELRNYFDEFRDRGEVGGEKVRSLYSGFNAERFRAPKESDETAFSLVMEETKSLLDDLFADQPAQLAGKDGTPEKKWSNTKDVLLDIDSSKLHFVKVPEKHIIIDFDLKRQNGIGELERNLEAASTWPPTYAEISQSGKGVHLHYNYTGDPSALSNTYSDGIEVKVFVGDASLRRRLSRCNAISVAKISSGLPLKPKKEKMLKAKTITSEKGLRDLIERNLRREIHPGTKSSVDFIAHILEEMYESGMKYDVTDLRPRILAFANNSTHHAGVCLKTVQTMQFRSGGDLDSDADVKVNDDRLVMFDVEVYPNLFVVCWKFRGDNTVVRMINPKPSDVEALFKLRLVGFYNRRYDNHILYAASMGYSNQQLFELSQKMIVHGKQSSFFPSAYNLSYADIYDFSSLKQSLKKFEIDLGIHHMELDLPWNQPVDEKDWPRVVEYCVNDVIATEAVFENRIGDFTARQILAELSGLAVNDTTQRHTGKIIFGEDKTPQRFFVYTDLSREFPGYTFQSGKSSYKDEDPGEGGYVYSEPGIYGNVAVLDVISMHPTSIEKLNMFGKYTEKFVDLTKVRKAIKRGDFKSAREMMDGRLKPYLENEEGADKLAYALKIVINIVYGLTSARFDNPFRDIRNVDNIAAKRGALFMIDLKRDIQMRMDARVIHIKTDSVKIPDAAQDVIAGVITFGSLYGYEFEHEVTYDKLCLVNDAVYIARNGEKWTAVGSQFQHPYVFKSLFSGEEITFDDFCESRSVVQGEMYLDREEHEDEELDYHRMRYLGRTGRFVPVLEGGGTLLRVKDGKYHAVTGTKGYHWLEADVAKNIPDVKINYAYFEKLKNDAIKAIDKFGSFEEFVR